MPKHTFDRESSIPPKLDYEGKSTVYASLRGTRLVLYNYTGGMNVVMWLRNCKACMVKFVSFESTADVCKDCWDASSSSSSESSPEPDPEPPQILL